MLGRDTAASKFQFESLPGPHLSVAEGAKLHTPL